MTAYYRFRLGTQAKYAPECFANGYVGVDFDVATDLSPYLGGDGPDKIADLIPAILAANPARTKAGAAQDCGVLRTFTKTMQVGDIVLCPDGASTFHAGRVSGGYSYHEGADLPHRRAVEWLGVTIQRNTMGEALGVAADNRRTIVTLTQYSPELEGLLGKPRPPMGVTDPDVEDPAVFALERHLEDFLMANWALTPLGRTHRVYEQEGDVVGRQFSTDTGPIDILAVSHDGSDWLVVELKKGRASDVVVGQIQRYMGYVADVLAEPGQTVHGVIIALDDDNRIRRALSVANGIDFYRYEVKFNLHKA